MKVRELGKKWDIRLIGVTELTFFFSNSKKRLIFAALFK
jgi:hypothetical protein